MTPQQQHRSAVPFVSYIHIRNSGGGVLGLALALVAMLALAGVATLALGAPAARANRAVLSEARLKTSEEAKAPPSEGQIEGACGLAVSGETLYVSDYYHRAIDAFSTKTWIYVNNSQIALPGGSIPSGAINELDGVCGLALGSGGALYANEFHEGVLRLKPSEQVFDTAESTGVATDAAGNVYVDDRTRVVAYEPSGAPLEVEDPVSHATVPLRLGEGGALGDAYGVAVSADGSHVYVPDAASGTVKVFEPAVSLTAPTATIAPSGGFVSLIDAALALDPTNGHVLVVDNAQPGYEHPGAALYEFGPAPSYVSLGKLACAPVFGGPSGVAFDSSGDLFVTNGNSERSNVFEYGPYGSSGATPSCAAGAVASAPASGAGATSFSAALAPPAGSTAAPASGGASTAASRRAAARHRAHRRRARARRRRRAARHGRRHARRARLSRRGKGGGTTLVQKGSIRVALSGGLAPTRLPRSGAAPIDVTVGGLISTTDPSSPPQLRKVSFAFNKAGRLDTKGLPRCRRTDIDPSSTKQALAACGDALVGEGRFAAAVRLPEQSPFPSAGKVTAFNGIEHGKPVVFAHIYGTKPVPTSIVLPLRMRQVKGRFATVLEASLAGLTGEWGYVRSIDLRLGRTYHAHGKRHSFLSAACPAPKGFPGAVFPLARAGFSFEGGKTLTATLTRSCTVRR